MSKRSAIILAAFALVAGAGIATLVACGHYRSYCRELVVSEYHLATSDGANFMQLDQDAGIGPERRARWRCALGKQLEAHLGMPWNSKWEDLYWGRAYVVLRDPGWEKWSFSPEMDDATRNDLIRYLCWRIEHGGGMYRGNHLLVEFHALGTYPPEALAPLSEMLERAFDAILSSHTNDTVYNAQRFLVSKLGQEWADRAARKYLKFYRYRDANYGQRVNTLDMFLSVAKRAADEGSRPAQGLLGYFVHLSREEPDYFRFQSGPRETAQAALKRIAAAGWAKAKE